MRHREATLRCRAQASRSRSPDPVERPRSGSDTRRRPRSVLPSRHSRHRQGRKRASACRASARASVRHCRRLNCRGPGCPGHRSGDGGARCGDHRASVAFRSGWPSARFWDRGRATTPCFRCAIPRDDPRSPRRRRCLAPGIGSARPRHPVTSGRVQTRVPQDDAGTARCTSRGRAAVPRPRLRGGHRTRPRTGRRAGPRDASARGVVPTGSCDLQNARRIALPSSALVTVRNHKTLSDARARGGCRKRVTVVPCGDGLIIPEHWWGTGTRGSQARSEPQVEMRSRCLRAKLGLKGVAVGGIARRQTQSSCAQRGDKNGTRVPPTSSHPQPPAAGGDPRTARPSCCAGC